MPGLRSLPQMLSIFIGGEITQATGWVASQAERSRRLGIITRITETVCGLSSP